MCDICDRVQGTFGDDGPTDWCEICNAAIYGNDDHRGCDYQTY